MVRAREVVLAAAVWVHVWSAMMSDRLRSVHFTRRSCYYATATKPGPTCSKEGCLKGTVPQEESAVVFEPGRYNDSVDSWMHGFMDAMLPRGTLHPSPGNGTSRLASNCVATAALARQLSPQLLVRDRTRDLQMFSPMLSLRDSSRI